MPTAPAKGGGGPPKLSSAVPGAAAVSGGADKGADKRECVIAEYIGGEWRATGELVQNLEAYLESHTHVVYAFDESPIVSQVTPHSLLFLLLTKLFLNLVDHEDLPRRRLRSPPPPYRLKDPMAPSRSESQPATSTSASNAVHNPSNTNASGDAQDASKESQDDVTCENFTHYPVLLDEFFLPPFLPPPFFPSSSLTPVANLLFGFGAEPVMPITMLKRRAPGFVAPNNFLLSVLSFSTLYNTPLYFTAARLRTSANAGLHLIPNSVCVAIDSLFAGWYMRKTGRYWKLQAFAGLGIVAANFSLASWWLGLALGFGKIGFAANDAATSLKMVEKGLLREDLAVAVLINFPFQIIGGWLKAAPIFVTTLLLKHDVMIADKNNHLRQHREGLRAAVAGRNPPVRLIALDWSLEGTAPADAHRVCAGRVAVRGTNHQSLRPSKMDARAHEQVVWMFINQTEPLAPAEVDVVEMVLHEGLEDAVARAVAQLDKPANKAVYKMPKFANAAFTIAHYALDVTYAVDGFLEKNRDTVPEEHLTLLTSSSNAFLREPPVSAGFFVFLVVHTVLTSFTSTIQFVGSSAFFTRISDRRRCSRSSRASRTTTSRSPPDVLGISLSAALTQTLLARNLRARITGVGRCCIDVQQLETAQHRPLLASASRPDVLRTRPEPLFDSSRSLRRHASRIMH
ncbi:hypothetical protein DFH07DRAFT_1001752 [Mycena maculata]|uniref:Uncharacterized protein n=1 Tax=Mycena maculata TaxID=230809 RepID=A0AAD7MP26_9AGAR|nr:hypothetical protein DFH07DRAFT_1001752 [Mycena maculata]